MPPGRLTAKEEKKAQDRQTLRDLIGPSPLVRGASAIARSERSKEFGPLGDVLTTGEQQKVGRLSALTTKVTGSEYLGSLVSRVAAPVKAIGTSLLERREAWSAKTPVQRAEELPGITRAVGKAFVEGLNSAILRFVKSGAEGVLGREKTAAIASQPTISKFAQDVTGRKPEEKIMTFQQIGEAVRSDALAHGATEEGASKVSSIAVLGAIFAENPLFPGRGVSKSAARFIADSVDPSAIKTTLLKEFPDFLNKATPEQLDIVSNVLVKIDKAEDVQTVLNRTGFAINGRLSAKQSHPPAVQQKLAEVSKTEPTHGMGGGDIGFTGSVPATTESATAPANLPQTSRIAEAVDEPLRAEAKKYKSVEEFVAGKTNRVGGFSRTTEDAIFRHLPDGTRFERAGVTLEKQGDNIVAKGSGASQLLAKSGIDLSPDGVIKETDFSYNKSIFLKDAGVDTQAQLTDIWNKANTITSDSTLLTEARKYKSAEEFVRAQEIPKTVRVWNKSKFSNDGAYTDREVVRKEDNIILYQGGSNEGRQFWTPDKKYASHFGEVKSKTGSFYKIKNGNTMTAVYVEAPSKSQLTDIWNKANETSARTAEVTPAPDRKPSTRVNTKLEKRVQEASTYAEFLQKSGITKDALDATVKAKGFKDAEEYYTSTKTKASGITEEESLNQLAVRESKSDVVTQKAETEEARLVSNLESVFADMKGVELADLKAKFTEEDLFRVKLERQFLDEAIRSDPAGGFVKYMSRTTGLLPEITGKPTMESLKGGKKKIVPNSKYGRLGDDINQTIFQRQVDPGEAQAALDRHLKMLENRRAFDEEISSIYHNIRLAKAKDTFVGKEKNRLARSLATNLAGLRSLVQSAERAGFRRGVTKGAQMYNALVRKNKARRFELQRIKKQYNLSDTEWATVRRQPETAKDGKVVYRDKDYREMDETAFSAYLKDVDERARARHERNTEKIIVDAIIKEKDLKRIENLQVAMELPHMNKMTAAQLREFAEQLNSTEAGGEYLPARMMQTLRNTDIGDAKTLGEAQRKAALQTNMPMDPVMGKGIDNWLRLPTLAARDPLHKLFIGDWIGGIVQMRSKRFHFKVELNSLKKAADRSRRIANKKLRAEGKLKQSLREKLFARILPEDKLVSQYLQPFRSVYTYNPNGTVKSKEIIIDPAIRRRAEAQMTPEEVSYAKFLERFFSTKWEQIARENQIRWTLRGVKHSNYRGEVIESVYLPHATRGFLERWRDDGFFSTVRNIFNRDIRETKIDFNAFGDRGKVLGYEKWLRNNMVRGGEGKRAETGEIMYSLNTAKVAEIYFEALEKKLVLDSLIPKVKLYEFLMGKRLQTPKHIGDPEGTEQVNSALRDHINKTLNTLKGQKSSGFFAQGGDAEGAINALKVWISIKYLGINLITQVVSGVGGQATTFAGIGLKGWLLGHVRAKTIQGRRLAQEYAGVVGEPPWFDIAKASNDAGDVFRSGIFYLFGALQYRAQRQMFLGMLTKDELKTGVISKSRQRDIRLRIGEWHPLSGDESVHGATAEMKLLSMFTSWAVPAIQTTYYKNLPRVVNMLRRAKGAEDLGKTMKSDEFQTLFRTVIAGAGVAAFAYFLFSPDKNDKSQAGYLRRRAAEEISTVIQAISLWGIPIPGSIVISYLETVRSALQMLLSGERYTEAGPGYAAGDLKAPDALAKAFVPSGITQLKEMAFGKPETPIKTEAALKKEVLAKIESGEMSVSAAKDYYTKQMENIEAAAEKKRFTLSEDAYKKDLATRIEKKEISVADAKKEFAKYQKQLKEYAPEKFESKSDADFIGKIQIAATALKTDPVTLFQAVFTGEQIRRMDNGEIILHRAMTEDPLEQRDWALDKREEFDANADLKLDHTIPLQLGGSNFDSNLKLVPTEEWENYTPVENYLGLALRNKEITGKEARDLILKFKKGDLTEEQVYSTVEAR